MKLAATFFALLSTLACLAGSATADLAPNERYSLVRLGMEYIDQWDVAASRKTLEQLLGDGEPDSIALYFKAQVLFHEGDYAGALKVIDALPTQPVVQGAPEFFKLVRDTLAATSNMVRHDTPHFAIYYVPGKDDILVPYAEDTLEKAYAQIGADLNWKPAEKVRVEIYPDSDSFIAVTTLTKQEIETSGTIALCKFNRLMITTPRALVRGYAYLDTLTHEYVHYALSRKTNNQAPLWLHEGVAKFEEQRWRSNNVAKLLPMSESLLAEALAKNYFITIEEMYPSLAKLKRAEDTQLAFAEVETMVGMVVRKGGYPMLLKLIDQFSRGKSVDDALQGTGGWRNMNAFLAEWKTYLKERGLKSIPGVTVLGTKLAERGAKAADAEDTEDLKSVSEKEAKDHLRLGDLLRDRRRFRASVYEYRKAKESSGRFNPVLLHKLGLAQMLAGDIDGAAVTFQEALDVYPNFGPVNRRLGEVLVSKKDFEKAREALEIAVGVNPFDPSVHSLLLQTYEALGNTAYAAREKQVLSLLRQ